MSDYLAVKKSQIALYKDTPFYYKLECGEYSLYKPEDSALNNLLISKEKHPQLYIHKENKETASKKMQEKLNLILQKNISSMSLRSVKSVLCQIIDDALSGPLKATLQSLPETIDILFSAYSKNSKVLKILADISACGEAETEHTVNVMAMTMRYCFFCKFPLEETKKISLAALLHDVGKTEIDKKIVRSNQKLSDKEFEIYKTHTSKGHDIIKQTGLFDRSQTLTALEHHERLDGSGYPRGIAHISFEGQLIGLIDCFEQLSNSEKTYRRIKTPFDSLSLIKDEVIVQGRFSKEIFKNLCSSLI